MGNCNFREQSYTVEKDPPTYSSSVLHEGPVLGVDYHNGTILTSSEDRRIAMTSATTITSHTNAKYLTGHSKAINCVKFGKKSGKVYSAARDLSAKVWNPETQECLQTLPDIHTLNITAITLPASERHFVTGSRDYSVKVWDSQTCQLTQTFSSPRNIVTTLQTSPVDDNIIFQGSEDLCLRIWDTRTAPGAPSIHITGYVYFPLSMSIQEDGNYVATGCKGFDSVGCGVLLWDIRQPSQPVVEYSGHSQDVTGCQFISPTWLVTTSKDGSMIAWDTSNVTTKTSPYKTQLTNKYLTCLASLSDRPLPTSTPNSSQLVAGSIDGSLSVVSFQSPPAGAKMNTMKLHSEVFTMLGGTAEYAS